MSANPYKGIEVRKTSIRIVFSHGGKQHHKTLCDADGGAMKPTPATIKYAAKLAEEIRRKIALSVFVMSEYFADDSTTAETTLGKHLDTWLSTLRLEDSTIQGYGSAVRFWKTAPYSADAPKALLGDRMLSAFSLTDLKTAVALRSDLSGKTINNYVSVLRDALALAVADGAIKRNVALELPKANWQRPPVDPFSKVEAEAILEWIRTHHPEPVWNMAEFWFFTGLRSSELVGLRWDNVDLASNHMVIKEVVIKRKRKESTKTSSHRVVSFNSRALAAITRQRAHTFVGGDVVFPDMELGETWNIENKFQERIWARALKACKLRYRRPYNCRHTYATMMLMADMNDAFCAKQLGHSVEVFRSTYAKWLDGDQNDREMSKLESAFGFTPGKSKEAS